MDDLGFSLEDSFLLVKVEVIDGVEVHVAIKVNDGLVKVMVKVNDHVVVENL